MRERWAIAAGVGALAGLGCIGLVGFVVGAVAFAGLVFMVVAWFGHQVIEVVPAISYWQGVMLAAGLWALRFAVRLAVGLLLGGARWR